MIIKAGEKLSIKELIQRLGIGEATWKRNKKDILLALEDVCTYEAIYSRKQSKLSFFNRLRV